MGEGKYGGRMALTSGPSSTDNTKNRNRERSKYKKKKCVAFNVDWGTGERQGRDLLYY